MISFNSGAGQVCGESRSCTTGGAIENKWEKPCVFVAASDFVFGFMTQKQDNVDNKLCFNSVLISRKTVFDSRLEVVKILPTKFLFTLSD